MYYHVYKKLNLSNWNEQKHIVLLYIKIAIYKVL